MILQVAILAVPLRTHFDYLPPEGVDAATLQPGIRLRLPFGRQQRIGILLGHSADSALSANRLKQISEVLDTQPLLPESLFQLLLQAATYYHHPLGEVLDSALPSLLRQGQPALPQREKCYRLHPDSTLSADDPALKRAPRQQQLLRQLSQQPHTAQQLREIIPQWGPPLQRLIEKGAVESIEQPLQPLLPETGSDTAHPLNSEQQQVVEQIHKATTTPVPTPMLLQGVTGSGKTEVYLQTMEPLLQQGRQVLILVPEISLTPQTLHRFQSRFGSRFNIALLHSGLGSRERLNGWLSARSGEVQILIGTRSAIFTPLANPGMIIVDEEHDGSFKQQEGFRYSARNLAVLRARKEQITVVLGSATPSFESLHNGSRGRYQPLLLSQRAGGARPPEISLIDMRSRKMEHLLSAPLLEKMAQHLDQQGQVLVFLNRRGYAPVLLCRSCGWSMSCPRCDIHYTLHQGRKRLVCHHCGGERPYPRACPECGSEEMKPLGAGTERVEEALQQRFPNHPVNRIDRDTTRRRGEMQRKLEQIHRGEQQILLGTQMLAKGHHFPEVTLVAILDIDGGLFGSDFRSTEQMGQLITQVAGRAGRAERSGEMVLQTYNPDHPLLQTLLREGYARFAREALAERKLAQLPPYSHLALIRAEATQAAMAHNFLQQVLQQAQQLSGSQREIEILGPVPAPMEKRAGRYRAQLLLQSLHRTALHQLLTPLLPIMERMKQARKVRWSVDVDPTDML